MSEAIRAAIAAGLQAPRHFEEIALLSARIGPDLISDISLRLLAPRFIAYTERVARDLNIPVSGAVLTGYALVNDRVVTATHRGSLPSNPHASGQSGILLVPKTLLRTLPTLNQDAFEQYVFDKHMDEVRSQFDIRVKADIRPYILSIARVNPQWVRGYVDHEESRSSRGYDFDGEDPDGFGSRYRQFYLLGGTASGGMGIVSTPDGVMQFVKELVRMFRLFVERNRGFTFLYKDPGSCTQPADEETIQRLFAGMSRGLCEHVDVSMAQESNPGGGRSDFRFSTGYRASVVMEIKPVRNGKFWNGAKLELPAYMANEDATHGMFVAVAFTEKEVSSQRWIALSDFVREIARESGLVLESDRVDARPNFTTPSKL